MNRVYEEITPGDPETIASVYKAARNYHLEGLHKTISKQIHRFITSMVQ